AGGSHDHGASEQDIGLTPLEYKLLHFIVVHPGQVFNRVQLMKNILEPGVHVNEENIYTHVCAVRRKLGIYASLLECIPRVGYRFAGTSTGGGQTSAA
ncbi:MAG: helix-turn-helix domain-containing protein, partial [Proteobacteria bacterium]